MQRKRVVGGAFRIKAGRKSGCFRGGGNPGRVSFAPLVQVATGNSKIEAGAAWLSAKNPRTRASAFFARVKFALEFFRGIVWVV